MLAKRSNALKSPRAPSKVNFITRNLRPFFSPFFLFPPSPDASTRRRPAISTLHTPSPFGNRLLPRAAANVRCDYCDKRVAIFTFPHRIIVDRTKNRYFFIIPRTWRNGREKSVIDVLLTSFFFLYRYRPYPSCQYFIFKPFCIRKLTNVFNAFAVVTA